MCSPITGTVKDQSILQFDHEVYVDQAPGWYRFADEAKRKRMTEANIMAMYGPSADKWARRIRPGERCAVVQ